MKKYLYIIKTTFNDSIQYISSLFIRFIGFAITMSILLSLWTFIYQDSTTISGYTLKEMFWYLLLTETITFGSKSPVATNEVKNCIKSGNIAYQINKPYHYIIYSISKYFADTLIRFIAFTIISTILGLIYVGPINNISIISFISCIPVFLLAVLITGMIKILISLTSFWVEDSQPFQMIYSKIILIFGIFFPIEMFPKIIGNILRYTPIYSVSYGPAKLMLSFNFSFFLNILITQIITIIIISVIINIVYRRGVRKLNVNGG